jgi:Flp pilus assembly CpaE family ATPase
VYSFAPVKEGVGASTIAIGTAVAIGRRRPGEGLMMDMDFSAGIASLALQAEADPRAWRQLARAGVDEALWPHLVTRQGGLDVVAPPVDGERTPGSEARMVLRAARTRYRTTLIDLPGQIDGDSIAAMKQSHVIFLVTTPELPALRLAHERLQQLRGERLDDRVELLLNRAGAIPRERIEDLLGCPVFFEFPNDYRSAATVIHAGKAEGTLGRSVDRFAATLLGDPVPYRVAHTGLAGLFASLTARFSRGIA